ncbi:FERM domain-containing protein 1 isoform X2 [Mixophyes fleayi]|uniref:FERM domain-containing protein 1 isoform X2 n=1 Tax=Mixophyes fleayi TaxID=3061075 RepID=UPI003F4DDD5B
MGKPLFQANMSDQDFYNICVWLPNREQLDITVRVKATGQELFEKVCYSLNIKEANFFGLSIVKNMEYIFIDLEQKLNKYFPKEWKKEATKTPEKLSLPYVAFFRVQYYVNNGRIISDRKARKFYYYQLKEQVLRSHCTHKEEVYFLLAAYALQADFGNQQNQNIHMKSYFEPEGYFPHWIIAKRGSAYILKHAPEMHKEQEGMSVKDAVLNFIKESCLLEDVPVHYYRLQKDVNHVRQLLYDFPWTNVGKITFLGKKFEIQPDGLPSARKLVYYTGSPFRSQHLLQLLSNSHRLYLNIQPVQKQIKKLEEMEGVELSVDNSHQLPVICTRTTNASVLENEEELVDSPTLDNHCWQVVMLRGLSVDSLIQAKLSEPRNSTDRYSRSLDDVHIYQQTHSLLATSVLTPDNSQSYTFGCAIEDKTIDYGCTYTTADCKVKSTLHGNRPMNCSSLDLLGDGQLLEYIL